MTTFLLSTFCVIKNCWELRLPWAKACYWTKTSPSDPWELAKLSSSLCAMLTQCTKSRTAACLQPEIASLQRPPTETSFFPLSPAINNKGVFGTPEHPMCLSFLHCPSQVSKTKPCWVQWKMFLKFFKKSLLHFYFFRVGGTCWGGTCGAQRTTFRASCSFSTWVPGIELSLAWLQVTSLPIEALNF